MSDQQSTCITTMISDFAISKTIGEGTFSKVKLAKHTISNQVVAIKMIEKDKMDSEGDQKRLMRELKIMRKVRHPHIVQLLEIIQDRAHIYLVTQYAEKGELFYHIVAQQKLPQFQAAKFLLQLLSAVEYIHTLGIVHRDLKPENLLLDNKYNIKLIDFGLSNVYTEGEKLKTACGSPCYAAPEMIKNQEYSGLKTDIWSCGIVLYAMCFGYLPFDDPQISVLYRKITEGFIQIPQHASWELKDLLRIVLKVNPNERGTIEQIRSHPFLKQSPYQLNLLKNSLTTVKIGMVVGLSEIPFQEDIQLQMERLGIPINQKQLQYSVKNNKHNNLTVTYFLLLQKRLRSNNLSLVNYYHQKNHFMNKYLLVEKVRSSYEERVKRQIVLLEDSRVKRALVCANGLTSEKKARLSKVKQNDSKKTHPKKQHQKERIMNTPQRKIRPKSLSKKTNADYVQSNFQSPNLNAFQFGSKNFQAKQESTAKKHSINQNNFERRVFSQGKKYKSNHKKLKKTKNFIPLSQNTEDKSRIKKEGRIHKDAHGKKGKLSKNSEEPNT